MGPPECVEVVVTSTPWYFGADILDPPYSFYPQIYLQVLSVVPNVFLCFIFQTRSIEMEWLGIQGFTVCCGGWHCWFYRKPVCNLIFGGKQLFVNGESMLVCVEINLTCELFSCLLLGMPLVNSLFLISPSGFWIDLILI